MTDPQPMRRRDSGDPTGGRATGGTGGPAPWLLGAVLAGGRSRRLGRDKAAERVGDTRMIDRAVETLRHACPEVVVVSARDDTPAGRWTVLKDERPGVGPLAGIETALAHATDRGASGAFVLACDLPLLDVPTVATIVEALRLLGAADIEAAPVAVAASRREGLPDFEPLCAAYRVSALPTLRGLLDRGESAARALFEAVGGVRVDAAPERLLNVNTASELERARREANRT